MASTNAAPQRPRRSSDLLASLRIFLTPALWKQVQQLRGPRRRQRWASQPLVLVLVALTWASGDSLPERFEAAKALVALSRSKRRQPGKTMRGFQRALSRCPLRVLRAVAAGVRKRLPVVLARGWQVDGWVPLGCDGTRLECPRSEPLLKRLKRVGKKHSAPAVWLTALVHLRWGVPWAWQWGKANASERTHLRRLLPVLPPQALVVTDAGYVGYDLVRHLLEQQVHFLIRLSCQATVYRSGPFRAQWFRQAEVYYWPADKQRRKSAVPLPPLRVRLIRIRGRKRRHDVWLATNVWDPQRLSREQAGQFYRWRWENEGFFRSYKRTLGQVKLQSRTVGLVHREAEGSLLATQLLLALGAQALVRRPTPADTDPAAAWVPPACSPRKVLLAIRQEFPRPVVRQSLAQRLAQAHREPRPRSSLQVKRHWPQRRPSRPPQPPRLRTLSKRQIALLEQYQMLIA